MSRAQYSDFVFYTGTVNPVVGVPITVYEFKTTTLATIYDQYGVAIANPVFTDTDGAFQFYADAGQYDIYLSGVKQYSVVLSSPTLNSSVQRFSGNNSTTIFTLSASPTSENNTQIYISGIYQQKDTYSVSGTTLTFSSAPPTGSDNIEVVVLM